MGTWLGYVHRRPVTEAARIDAGTLARFLRPLTWPEIRAIDPRIPKFWWTYAVGNAEDRGLLRWLRERRAWILTEAGAAWVRDVS
jgi:hypothetical protein